MDSAAPSVDIHMAHLRQGSTPSPAKGASDLPDCAQKTLDLDGACANRDVALLRKLATTPGGLVDDRIRRTAWPLLLGCGDTPGDDQPDLDALPAHRDEDQVQLDVDRSFVYYPQHESDHKTATRKRELSKVIVTVLRRFPTLHYFQGYHDIVQVFSLVLGSDACIDTVSRLSLLRIRDFMLPTMSGTEPHLQLLPVILHAADPTLASHLSQLRPFFALPATLTMYAHEIEEYGEIARLFDFLLATEAVTSVYLFAVMVMSRKDELLEIEADEPDILHVTLSKLPKPLDLDGLIQQTVNLFDRFPPEKLPGHAWWRISTNSVLKTTRSLDRLLEQTTSDGIRFYQKEAAEISRREALVRAQKQARALAYRYRRPATWTGAAVAFALIALYFQADASSRYPFGLAPMLGNLQQRFFNIWRQIMS